MDPVHEQERGPVGLSSRLQVIRQQKLKIVQRASCWLRAVLTNPMRRLMSPSFVSETANYLKIKPLEFLSWAEKLPFAAKAMKKCEMVLKQKWFYLHTSSAWKPSVHIGASHRNRLQDYGMWLEKQSIEQILSGPPDDYQKFYCVHICCILAVQDSKCFFSLHQQKHTNTTKTNTWFIF